MIFEIRDLKHATPATVSRAGILYISTDEGRQWRSLINSWVDNKKVKQNSELDHDNELRHHQQQQQQQYSPDIIVTLEGLFAKYIDDALTWLLLNAKAVVPIEDMNRVQVLLNMLDGCLNEVNTATPEALEVVFVYCTVWALGSSLGVSDDGTDYRKLFSDWWRGRFDDGNRGSGHVSSSLPETPYLTTGSTPRRIHSIPGPSRLFSIPSIMIAE